jgi:hypothetical protein
MQNLYDYKKELEANPQTTDIKLKKINEIISKEESWIKSQ